MAHPWTQEEEKVLRAFLDGERIVRLPAKQKKRLVILRWLLERIEPEKRFPERELNILIARHHPDFATIRRELFEFGFMHRERGIYWRTDRAPEDPQPEQD
ncbi:DUF2087 domain-containing protein [Candidatus Bipolaricaulota bacterium]|jgi:hypothetical protein|nr:DUF2087 domain-containing protein [Candidatus Bipolaricaulota bacterium]TFH09918.1 MAG: DUF2087 domain-containing protein [Candidatus Atribacteria bacterium]